MKPAADGHQFAVVAREPRLSDKVADQLRGMILARSLPPGARLPTERELGKQFGVSRTVVREAVRSLVAKGLVDARGGSGLVVSAVGASAVRETMGMFLHGSSTIQYPRIHEVRSVLEVRTTELAAARATREDIERLRASHEGMTEALAGEPDLIRASELDVEFHRTIAEITQNELFVVMLDSIGDILLEVREATLGIPGRAHGGIEFHQRILDCIAAHDVAGAAAAMQAHLDDAEAAWRRLARDRPAGDDEDSA